MYYLDKINNLIYCEYVIRCGTITEVAGPLLPCFYIYCLGLMPQGFGMLTSVL